MKLSPKRKIESILKKNTKIKSSLFGKCVLKFKQISENVLFNSINVEKTYCVVDEKILHLDTDRSINNLKNKYHTYNPEFKFENGEILISKESTTLDLKRYDDSRCDKTYLVKNVNSNNDNDGVEASKIIHIIEFVAVDEDGNGNESDETISLEINNIDLETKFIFDIEILDVEKTGFSKLLGYIKIPTGLGKLNFFNKLEKKTSPRRVEVK